MLVIISSFIAGQGLILALMLLAQSITYTSNLLAFCLWFACGADGILIGGIYLERIIQAYRIKRAEADYDKTPMKVGGEIKVPRIYGKHEKVDMDEVPALPKELEVTNEFIKRAGK